MPNEITKMDIAKTKHDLICMIITKMQMEREAEVNGKDGWNHGYIAGVSELAEKLLDMMDEEYTEDEEDEAR